MTSTQETCNGVYFRFAQLCKGDTTPVVATIKKSTFSASVDCLNIIPDSDPEKKGICLASLGRLNPDGTAAKEAMCIKLRKALR